MIRDEPTVYLADRVSIIVVKRNAGRAVLHAVVLLANYIDLLGRVVGVEMAQRLTEQAFAPAEDGMPSVGPAAETRKGE